MIRRWWVTLSILMTSSAALADRASSLTEVLELAKRNHPTLMQERAKLEQVRAQLDEAHWAPFSQFKSTGGVGLAPTTRGNNVYSPNTDVSLSSSLGVAWRVNVEGVVPLWTFGKITNLWDAAEANVRVHQAQLEVTHDAIAQDVRKAYFGLQLARDSRSLLVEAREKLNTALENLRKQAEEEEDADPIDLLKMETFAAELDVKEAEAERFFAIAQSGLRFLTGDSRITIDEEELREPRHKLGHLTRYLEAARLYRPELAMAGAGIDARRAQLAMERSQLFPDIGLGLNVGLSAAPEVANQINPYTSDGGNYFRYGAALVFQWKMDFLPESAKIRYAEAQLNEVVAQQRFALGGVAFEVEEAYAEVVDWTRRIEAYRKAVQSAKRWLVVVEQGIDVGTQEEKDRLEPAKAYALHRFNLLSAIMELDLAMGKLAKVTGWDEIAPDGT